MARVVRTLGKGGQRFAERILGWNRGTMRKGLRELESGHISDKRLGSSGRRRIKEKPLRIKRDICSIPDATGQTDPTFRSTRIYTPVAAKQVRRRLIEQCGYRAKELPCVRTISSKIAVYGFRPQKVKKCRPIKKIPETVAIFEEVRRINAEADKAPSLPANIAGYQSVRSRFYADEKLVPFGMLLPRTGESYLWCTKSKVTADFMVDRLEEIWPKLDEKYRTQIRYSSG